MNKQELDNAVEVAVETLSDLYTIKAKNDWLGSQVSIFKMYRVFKGQKVIPPKTTKRAFAKVLKEANDCLRILGEEYWGVTGSKKHLIPKPQYQEQQDLMTANNDRTGIALWDTTGILDSWKSIV